MALNLLLTYWLFCLPRAILKKKMRIYHAWFLFVVTPGVDSFSGHLEQSISNKMVSKIQVEMSTFDIYSQ